MATPDACDKSSGTSSPTRSNSLRRGDGDGPGAPLRRQGSGLSRGYRPWNKSGVLRQALRAVRPTGELSDAHARGAGAGLGHSQTSCRPSRRHDFSRSSRRRTGREDIRDPASGRGADRLRQRTEPGRGPAPATRFTCPNPSILRSCSPSCARSPESRGPRRSEPGFFLDITADLPGRYPIT